MLLDLPKISTNAKGEKSISVNKRNPMNIEISEERLKTLSEEIYYKQKKQKKIIVYNIFLEKS